jgi:hypothetical protein
MTEPQRRFDHAAELARARADLDDGGRLWVLEELSFMWRAAQREASLAYCQWRRLRDRPAYASYRAAQDRADAAQDALSERHAAEFAARRRGPATTSLRPTAATDVRS